MAEATTASAPRAIGSVPRSPTQNAGGTGAGATTRKPGDAAEGPGGAEILGAAMVISLVEGLIASLFNIVSDILMGLSLIPIIGWLLFPFAVVFSILIWACTLLWLIMRGVRRGLQIYVVAFISPFRTIPLWIVIAMNNVVANKLAQLAGKVQPAGPAKKNGNSYRAAA